MDVFLSSNFSIPSLRSDLTFFSDTYVYMSKLTIRLFNYYILSFESSCLLFKERGEHVQNIFNISQMIWFLLQCLPCE